MILASSNLSNVGRLRSPTEALTEDNPFLYSLAKLMFPKMPRVVRARKLRVLCVSTLVALSMCASMAFVLWLADRGQHF